MIYDEKDQMEKDINLWKFRLRVKSHVIPSQHHEESDRPAYQGHLRKKLLPLKTSRSAFNLLAARIASVTDIELLKTIFD